MRQAGPWIWGEQTLYVGYTALALALAGLLIRRPRRLTPDGEAPPRTVDARWIATGICLVIVGFLLAKGFVSSQEVRLPLLHLSEVPGLDFLKGLRATQRYSLLLYFGIMILSGAGAATLAARCRSARSAWIAISLVCLVFLAEVYPIRLPFEPRPYEISRLDVAIPKVWRDETRAPVVVHLPIHYFLRAYATPEAVYMLDSTHHWARVVNGFSGASPRGFRQTMEALNALPESRGVAALVELGVDLVAIHRSAPAASRRSLAAFFEEGPWATVYHVGDEHLVRIDAASIPAELVGVTATGFRGTERAAGRAFRWTTGAARLSFPIDPLAPPSELAVDVLMTGPPKGLRIIVAGDCVLFDDTIRNRWSGTFALDACRLTAPTLEIALLSDTHVPDTGDNRTLGIGVAAVELRGGGKDAALAFP